ncbi:MAG: HDOD domain-containing protein [Gammaproteobacteria bacterium]|nr:HDOD domain-containing protein [Gammaproteobacteria bacterium]
MTTHQVFRAVLDYLSIPAQCSTEENTSHPANACSTLLKDDNGFVVAIYPAKNTLTLNTLRTVLHRDDLTCLNSAILDSLNEYFESQVPKPGCNGIKFVFDVALSECDNVIIQINDQYIQLPQLNISALSNHSLFGSQISQPESPSHSSAKTNAVPKLDIRSQLENIQSLPVMPEMATKILALRDNQDATVNQLAEVISMDTGLAAQILRYANSALFGQRGKVKTLDDAIFRVLGFENVLHMALGSALAHAFKLPDDGKLSAEAYWHNATFSASLIQKLAQKTDKSLGIKPGLAYLCGLMHNIGYLVLGTLFPSEYFWFNKVISAKKDTPVAEIEQQLLGITHTELGAQLMAYWNMPEEIITVISKHHTLEYTGKHDVYVQLVIITDQLLKGHNMSDADCDEPSELLCQQLGLNENDIYQAMDEVLQSGEDIDALVKTLAA